MGDAGARRGADLRADRVTPVTYSRWVAWLPENEARVELTQAQIDYAMMIGEQRTRVNDAYADGAIDPNRSPTEIDRQGAIGELATALFLDVPWSGIWSRTEWVRRRTTAGDVGCVQVKSVNKATHRLLIPLKDSYRTDAVFVLVFLHELPSAMLAGWCEGEFAIQDHRIDYTLPVPAYAIPPTRLGPMSKLKSFLQQRGLARVPRSA